MWLCYGRAMLEQAPPADVLAEQTPGPGQIRADAASGSSSPTS